MLNLLAVIFGFFAKLWAANRKPPTDTRTQQQLEKAQDAVQEARNDSDALVADTVQHAGDPGRVLANVNEAINNANRELQ